MTKKHYIGLDVSLKETHICVVDACGEVVACGREATNPELLADAIARLAPCTELAVLEIGGQSSWLQRGLQAHGVRAVIVDARRAKAALSCRMNKTDANEAGADAGAAGPDAQKLVEQIRGLPKHLLESADYVGDKFADEARKIHYEEVDKRGIYGEASLDEARELLEEGVGVLPIPSLPEDHN